MHDVSEMTETDKQRYCTRDYAWCGRYIIFGALQRELERGKSKRGTEPLSPLRCERDAGYQVDKQANQALLGNVISLVTMFSTFAYEEAPPFLLR